MNRKFPVLGIVLIALGAIVGGVLGRMPMKTLPGSTVTSERVISEYQEALNVIDGNYFGKADHDKLSDSSIQSMLWTLDPHSSFFNQVELNKLDEEQSSQFYGIGVSILQHRNGVYVQSVVPGTPAEKAGLRYGDRFLQVDGKDAKEWSSSEVSKNVRGVRGTAVKVKVERAGSADPVEYEIVRGGVPLPSVRNYFMLPNSIGYVGLTGGFQQTTGDELRSSIAELKKSGMKSLVLDLRGNPGGILEQAISVVSKFIPGGQTVVSVKSSRFDQFRELKATGGDVETFPMVVVINGGSASASEIVAGAIQDYDRGLIIGSDSFGKGLVQRVFRLPYSTGLTLTTARYYTPFGRSLQRDYSSGSIYDYYTHLADSPDHGQPAAAPKPAGSPVTAANGRVLYGGRGIEPDIRVDPTKADASRARVNEAAFFFVRQLVAGKVGGFESYKNERQNFKQAVQINEFQIADKLYEAFRTFAANDREFGLTAENINNQAEYARTRLREEIATANYSSEAGIQVLLENDPQIVKALASMPQAAKLVDVAELFAK